MSLCAVAPHSRILVGRELVSRPDRWAGAHEVPPYIKKHWTH